MSPFERLRNLAEEHSEKYDPGVPISKEGAGSNTQGSLYYEDLETRAARENKTLQQVFQRDQELLSSGDFPSAACLRPEEVLYAAFRRSRLAETSKNHLEGCLYCRAIVAHSRAVESPRATAIAQELARVHREEPASARESAWWRAPGFPLMRAALLSLSLLAGMTSVLSVWFVSRERRFRQEAVAAVRSSYDAMLSQTSLEKQQLESKLDAVRSLVMAEEMKMESQVDLKGKPKLSDLIGNLPDIGRRDDSAIMMLQLKDAIKPYAAPKAY